MLFDKQLLWSDEQDISQTQATYASTNVLDLEKASPRQIGPGNELYVFWQIIAAVTGTSSTLQVRLVNSAAAGLGSPTVLLDSGAIAEATLIAGYGITWVVPTDVLLLRYVGLDYTIGTATTDGGTITAGIVASTDTKVKGVWTGVSAAIGNWA